MIKDELKISSKDWINILIIGILFGFFQSLIFYFLNENLQTISTIVFSISTAFFIAIFAIIIPVINKITIEIITSVGLASPIIILNGIQNGDEIGNIDAKTFNSLAGFIIVKYDK